VKIWSERLLFYGVRYIGGRSSSGGLGNSCGIRAEMLRAYYLRESLAQEIAGKMKVTYEI
jgi:hypothetical protein